MPIYEYVCQDCQTAFERLLLGKNGDISCPKCGSRQATVQFSVFAASQGENSEPDAAPCCGSSGTGCGCAN